MSVLKMYELLEASELVVFDCRFQLHDVSWGYHEYLSAHIPGAYYLDLNRDLAGVPGPHGGRHPLPDVEQLTAKLRAAGVDEDSTVVVYDSGEGLAPRAWWVLRYLGLQKVYVLDGGIDAWKQAGYPCSTDIPELHKGTFAPTVKSDWVVDVNTVRGIVTGTVEGTLVDARSSERFRGEAELIDRIAGHIPTAKNKPWTDGLDEHGFWLDEREQRVRFSDLSKDREPIVAYCGSGVTACALIYALNLAGFEDVKLYVGSWSDWITYENSPVETGGSAVHK